MKAIVIDDYGGADQLHLRELPNPRPHADEILVRVRAAGVNPVDWKIRQGQLRFIVRPNFPFIPGGDIAVEVVSAGPEVTEFKAGDPVVGCGIEARRSLCRVGGRKENRRRLEVAVPAPIVEVVQPNKEGENTDPQRRPNHRAIVEQRLAGKS
jgi:NADPH:quinone reductase-like Zn-dependent oxidoreductase